MIEDQFLALLAHPLTLSGLGLLVGSFLNVVIYRLPEIIKRQQIMQAAGSLASAKEIQQTSALSENDALDLAHRAGTLLEKIKGLSEFNLSVPRSRCPHCGHLICWYENIPLVSWMMLKGRCRSCAAPISARYPLVELATSVCFGLVALVHPGLQAIWWCCAAAMLMALALIDFDTRTMPKILVAFLLWTGILGSVFGLGIFSQSALVGAAAGYVVMRLLNTMVESVSATKSRLDPNLMAALGAWFGIGGLTGLFALWALSAMATHFMIRASVSTGINHSEKSTPFGLCLCSAGLVAILLPVYF